MRIQFNYAPEDLQEGLGWNGGKTRRSRRVWGFLIWTWFALLVAALFVYVRLGSSNTSQNTTLSQTRVGRIFDGLQTAVPWLLIIVFLGLVYWKRKRQYLAVWRKFPDFQQPQTMVFDENGVGLHTPLSEIVYRWNYIVNWAETRNLLILVLPGDLRVLIPKRAVEDERQVEQLRDILRVHIHPATGGFPIEPSVAAIAPNKTAHEEH